MCLFLIFYSIKANGTQYLNNSRVSNEKPLALFAQLFQLDYKIATIILFYLKTISLIIAIILMILVFVFLIQKIKLNSKQRKCEHSKCSHEITKKVKLYQN